MKHLLFLAILAGILAFMLPPVFAKQLPRLVVSRIDSLFAYLNTNKTPGAVVVVVKDGEVLYQRAFGMADIARGEKLTPSHAFWVASVTKQFTAASIALLAEEGRLRLEDDIRTYLPELPDFGEAIQVQHLVHHTSGLRDGFTLIGMQLKGEKFYTNDKVFDQLCRQEQLNFSPGTRYEYNNSGYVLLAKIVERISGQLFPEFVEEHIFLPLGMKNSYIAGNFFNRKPLLAQGYNARHHADGRTSYKEAHFKGDTWGSSGLVTTVEDLLRWDSNFYHNRLGAGNQLLIQQLLTVGQLKDGSPIPYAYGLEVAPYEGYLAVSHSGADPGYRAELVRFPNERLSIICLGNTSSLYHLTSKLLQIGEWVLKGKVTAAAAPATNTISDELPGYYLNTDNNTDLLLVSLQSNQLFARQSPNGYSEPYIQISEGTFQDKSLNSFRFAPAVDGTPSQIHYHRSRERTYWLQKMNPAQLSADKLQAYAGTYYSPELDKKYRLRVRKGKLCLVLYGLFKVPFVPLEGDRFVGDLFGNNCLLFTTAPDGSISGFLFNRDGVSQLAFKKLR